MIKYIIGVKRKTSDASDTSKTKLADSKVDHLPKPKSRIYNDTNLALGFTVNVVGQRDLCVLCLKTLAADSMQPNKFQRHLETLHPTRVTKPL